MTDVYATHLPVLKAIGKLLNPHRIIEFGCGIHSTSCFLDRIYFPKLEKLDSFESDHEWYDKCIVKYKDDPRLQLFYSTEQESLKLASSYKYDLAFVDGATFAMRVPTVAYAKALAPVIILHDVENYPDALKLFKFTYVYKELVPWTAVLSDSQDFSDILEQKNPIASVIMTAYNRSHLLPATLESIFKQQYSFEVIVVEDGFDGGETKKVCEKFPVRYFCRRDRPELDFSNPSVPNNIGIRQARGKVLIFQNAENIHLTVDSIQQLSEVVLANPKITAFASVWAADPNGNFMQWYVHPEFIPRPLFFCQAIDKEIVLHMRGFDEDFLYYGCEDDDFTRRLAQLGINNKFMRDVIVKHQWHPPCEKPEDTDRSNMHRAINAQLYKEKAIETPVRNINREWGKITIQAEDAVLCIRPKMTIKAEDAVPCMRPDPKFITGLVDLVADLPDKCVMAEVGCYIGESTEIFARKASKIYAIDPWADYFEPQNILIRMDGIESRFDQLIKKFPCIVKLKGTSAEIARKFPNRSLDVVYIDADHKYNYVIKDIHLWLPKIKLGGIICGHDYNLDSVFRAVNDSIGIPHKLYQDYSWAKRLPSHE
jgi:glycosyltransferase involved in cell wall biosynthesis